MKKKQLIVRLLESIDERLRPLALFHGDLSILVEEAITATDLATMELIALPSGVISQEAAADRPKIGKATTFLISETTLKLIERAAKRRRKSNNVIVNSALLWWLDNAAHRLRRP